MNSFNFKIAGAAGEGIKVAGLMLARTALKAGYAVHGYTEYPSLIRGGHNTFQVLAREKTAPAPQIALDLFIALNPHSLDYHRSELTKTSLVLTETDLAWSQLAKTAGNLLTKNTVALGASCYLLSLDLKLLQLVLKKEFADKPEAITKQNLKASRLGFEYSRKHFSNKKLKLDSPRSPLKNQILINGNEALALGAVAAGMKFYCAYPMTPVTPILHYLAANADRFKIIVNHAEDEIGVINMALGAGFAGVRCLVATSGGGFSLMTEGLGLAGGSETPVVVVLGMRPGPASGMPTWSSQGDLLFAIHASQDEFPRIVLTPGDPEEAFALAKLAQNLAEKYQLPVIILTDKYLGESYFTCDRFPSKHSNQRFSLAKDLVESSQPFKRYRVTSNGISARPLPGQPGGVHLANSYEHDQLGYATEDPATRTSQVDKRMKKLTTILNSHDLIPPRVYGPTRAKTTLISWGSNKGIILEALTRLPETNFIHFPWVWPFPAKQFLQLIKHQPRLISIEANPSGQLNRLIRQQTGVVIKDQLLKYDGRPFYPEEII